MHRMRGVASDDHLGAMSYFVAIISHMHGEDDDANTAVDKRSSIAHSQISSNIDN
jgi:hypothetical protein